MPNAARRSSGSPRGDGSDGTIAALVLVGIGILLAFLLIFRFGGDQPGSSPSSVVTVGATASQARSAAGSALSAERPAAAHSASGQQVGAGLTNAVRQSNGRFIVGPTNDPAILSAAGLRPGDVLLDIDGLPLDAGRVDGLPRELSTLDRVEFTFERDGMRRSRTIELNR